MALIKNIKEQLSEYISIYDLLKDKKYTLPNFQRKYAWEKKEINIFLNSFFELLNLKFQNDKLQQTDFHNYIGTIVLVSDFNKKNMYKIIDGQQRLITIVLMLKAIETILKEKLAYKGLQYKNHMDQIQQWIGTLQGILIGNPLNNVANKKNQPLITAKNNDKATLLDLLNIKSIKEISTLKNRRNKIIKNYLYIYDRLQKQIEESVTHNIYSNLDEINILSLLIVVILNDTFVLKTEFNDLNNAFKLFESLNNTGLSLTAFDLVNGLIESRFDYNTVKDYTKEMIEEKYKKTIIELESKNISLENYLFYWISSFQKPVSKSNLYDEVKERIEKDLYSTVEDLTNSFLELFNYLEKNDLYSVKYIQLLNRKKIIPIYLVLLKKKYNEREIESFMTYLVKYSVMELNILQKSPGVFQYKIQKIKEYILTTDKKISFKDVQQNVDCVINDYDSYSFTTLSNWKEQLVKGDININPNFVKTILFMFLQKEEPIRVNFNDIQAEHLFPQKPDKEWYQYSEWKKLEKNPEERNKIINNIGNIILLEGSINNANKNKYITKKKQYIEELLSNSKILKEREWNSINYDNFSPTKIIDRTDYIINLIFERKILFI